MLRRSVPALLALLACGLAACWRPAHPEMKGPGRFQVQVAGVEGLRAEGLRSLMTDILEIEGPWVPVESPPGEAPSRGTHFVLLAARWQGSSLILDARLDGQPLPRVQGAPLEALGRLCAELGIPAPGGSLIPDDPEAFPELVELLSAPLNARREDLERRADALSQRIPDCASVHLARARYITDHPLTLEDRQRCEQNLSMALEAYPGHPRATASIGYFLTNTGRQREALDLLFEALRRHPQSPHLLSCLAYAARTAGLLQVADRALDLQAAATGLPRLHTGLADNTRLYLGDLDGFEKGLPRVDNEALRAFYQGYARLLRGDRAGALAAFHRAKSPPRNWTLFTRLGSAYAAALEGRQAESIRALEDLEAERVKVSVPDGELTFKVAEAYGFLGQPKRALEVMAKAAVQGFGCTRWYERSPFLEEARKLPAWPRLRQTLQKRQSVLDARFPLQRLES